MPNAPAFQENTGIAATLAGKQGSFTLPPPTDHLSLQNCQDSDTKIAAVPKQRVFLSVIALQMSL